MAGPTTAVSSEDAVRELTDALKRRDDELDELREQLSKLKHELGLASAERDQLKADSKEDGRGLGRRESEEFQGPPPEPDLATVPGECVVPQVEDSRIGKPKRILIIGGGPAGIIALHEFLHPFNRPKGLAPEQIDVQLYERRAEVGGVWYFEPENDIAKGWHHGAQGWHTAEDHLPKTDQNGDHHSYNNSTEHAGDMEMMDPSWWKPKNGYASAFMDTRASHQNSSLVNGDGDEEKSHPSSLKRQGSLTSADFCYRSFPQNAPRWPSPAYEGLVGNVLPPLVEFGAKPMPKPQGGLFPSMVETHGYLQSIAAPYRSRMKTNQEVVGIQPKIHASSKRASWIVTKIDWSEEGQGGEFTEEWDAVILACGAFDHPFYPPDIPGLADLLKEGSPLVMHAKTYPGPRPFVNQHNKFVVVGNANSANDIAAHLAPLNSSGPLFRCIRHPSNFAHLPDPRIKDVAPIASIKYSSDRQTLQIELQDGTKLEGITKLIYASGYEYRFSWVRVPAPNADLSKPDSVELESASKYGAVPNLHNTTFVASAPTIAFIGLNAGSSPMPLAEIQSRVIARTWYNLLSLPDTREGLLESFQERAKELDLKEDDPTAWRSIHMVRGAPERKITAKLLDMLEESEKGASKGLFRWDEWREGVAKTLRSVKEAELRRLRNAKVAAGGVDGGVGGVLAYGPTMGQRFNPVVGDKATDRGKSLML